MNSEDNKFNDTTRKPKPEGNSNIENTGSQGTEPPKDDKSNAKEQIGKVVENMKPYADKAWLATKDFADFVKVKAPDIIEAAKQGLQEAKETVQNAYDKFQQHRAEKKDSTTTTTTTTTDSISKTNSSDSNNRTKQQ
jgi:hypothetical protein